MVHIHKNEQKSNTTGARRRMVMVHDRTGVSNPDHTNPYRSFSVVPTYEQWEIPGEF